MPTVPPRHSVLRPRSMPLSTPSFGRTSAGLIGAVLVLASCAGDTPTGLNETPLSADAASVSRVSICHRSGTTGTIIQVAAEALPGRLRHGDYLTSLMVSHATDQPSDGAHFRHIGDALAAARAGRLARDEGRTAACRITITVAAENFRGTSGDVGGRDLEHFPLVVDVPDLTLHGAMVMRLDANGRATGGAVDHVVTALTPIEPLGIPVDAIVPLIVANGHPGGSAGHGLTIEGFVMRSGWAGLGSGSYAVFAIRVRRLVIRGNRFEEGFDVPLDLRETNASIVRNHISGTGLCDICLAGPGSFTVSGNRLLAGALEGILTTPAIDAPEITPPGVEPPRLTATAVLSAEITNNEVRDHRRLPVGTGIRIGAVGLGTPDVYGTSHVTIRDNLLVNDNFALMIEGSFPGPGSRGDIDATFGGNVLRQSCQADLFVAFARHTTGLGLFDDPNMVNSTYRLSLGGDLPFSAVWFSNPKGFGNQLVVDGRTIAHGYRRFFDAESCPARTGTVAIR
jgi:hypothetical protein